MKNIKEQAAAEIHLEEKLAGLSAYELKEKRFLPDIDSDSYVLVHKKTGARIGILPNEDSNKVFYIAFRTPPKDSTGVAHIIEHTVLCGSKDFPVKDPFVELVKGSLNTFLNAMTFPDKTMYPVASTNDKDFANLMHVYLDAVFYPNIYKEQNIFRQEGWHYEALPDENGELSEQSEIAINGVVYNEMKGVMSSPEDVLGDKILASLYPDTTYSIVSGGDPEVIPELSYDDYLEFHRTYYHPSNSYLYLYGDMDVIERLTYLDEAYLSHFDRIDVKSEIVGQDAFESPVEEIYPYSIMDGEETNGRTFLSVNYSLPSMNGQGTKAQMKRDLAFKVLDYVLCDAEGAPIKEALRKSGIGLDVDSLFDDGILQPYYSIVAKYADKEQKDDFLRVIDETLKSLVKEGINKKSLAAGINNYEFHYREADFGSYPKGLVYGIDAMDLWLYDDQRSPWEGLDIGWMFDELKEDAKTDYFEKLLQETLLDNKHKSIVLLVPSPGLTEKNDAAFKDRMKQFAASLTSKEKAAIIEETKQLKKWQETPDSKEQMESIPVLSRDDLGKDSQSYVNEVKTTENGMQVLTHPVFTSGIDYVTLLFDLSSMPEKLFPYLPIFKAVLGLLSTEHYGFSDLDHEINIVTGGIMPTVASYSAAHEGGQNFPYQLTMEVHLKAMHENIDAALALVEEILLHTNFDEIDRIKDVLEEERSDAKSDLPSSGHSTAAGRALSYLSESSAAMDQISGLSAYRTLDRIVSNFEEERKQLPDILRSIAHTIFQKENMLPDVTADAKDIPQILRAFDSLADALSKASGQPKEVETKPHLIKEGKAFFAEPIYRPNVTKKNEGFTTAGQVQFVARAGNFKKPGVSYSGALRVLKVILGYDYLWQNIRVLGGAYGCMSGFTRDGNAYFVTYRDPHLKRSVQVFEEAAEYIRHFEADDRTMTKYVIGAVSTLDRPLSPKVLGRYSLTGFMTGFSMEDMQKEREEVLATSVEDIRSLAGVLSAFMEDDCICVVGGKEKIEENKDLFNTIEALV